jgi:hypothetical protein
MPLFPLPKTSAGGRLQSLMGITRGRYLRQFDRVNLLQHFPGKHKRDDKFPMRDAKIAAAAMYPLLLGRPVIFVGRNVAGAFGFDIPFHEWHALMGVTPTEIAVIPHPSGRNHWYNSPSNQELARLFWAEFLEREEILQAGQPKALAPRPRRAEAGQVQ